MIFLLLVVGFSCNSAKEQHNEQALEVSKSWQMPDTAAYARMGKTKLSDYEFFEGSLADLNPSARVFPYNINSPLFSDYAQKKRFIYLPEGMQIEYQATAPFDFPEGSILIKNFYFTGEQLGQAEDQIIETRLLIKERNNWKSIPYVWNDEQTDAFLELPGRDIHIELVDQGEMIYTVPTTLQCKSCHDTNGKIEPIGSSARQLNKSGQLEKLVAKGWLKSVPDKKEWSKMVDWANKTNALDDRAKAYLEINCGHCHKPNGPAKNSGLNLMTSATNPLKMGIFKSPVAAGKGSGGLKYDIVPGKPDESILLYRMKSTDPAIMMPELGKAVVHQEGVALIADWIESMGNK